MNVSDILRAVMAFWDPYPVPVRHLIWVAEIFNFSDNATRVALRRLCLANKIHPQRVGGRPGYSFTKRSALFNQYIRQACSLNIPDRWKGDWLQILLRVSEKEAAHRSRLKTALKVFGFASLYRGVWMRPWNIDTQVEQLRAQLTEFDVTCTMDILTCQFNDIRREQELCRILWELDEKFDAMNILVKKMECLIDTMNSLPIKKALVATFALANKVTQQLFSDPLLPNQLFQEPWPRDQLRQLYERLMHESTKIWIAHIDQQGLRSGIESQELKKVLHKVLQANLPEYRYNVQSMEVDGHGLYPH